MVWGSCEVIQKVEELDIKLDALWQAMVYCFLKEVGNENELDDEKDLRMHFSIKLDEGMARGNFWIEEKGNKNGEEILMFGEDLLFRKLDVGEIDKIEMKINNYFDFDKKDLEVVISSIACRLPGNISSPDQFWALLKEGRSTNQRIPATRIAERNSLIRGEFNGGNVPVEGGHFLNFDLARFDANFFGLSALEASALDPQQRLLLECTWECVEQAGCNSPKDLEQCGVFIGFMSNEYQDLSEQQGNALQIGPTLSIDTACSSSLVALQLAVEAIRTGRCPRAIVGGVNLTLTAKGLAQRANAGMLAEDGCCRVFDIDANGYGRSDGCVVMMIEGVPIENLERKPHWGAVECGHDGRSAALTAPNGLSQQQLLARCLERLNIEKRRSLRFWECHGTGTALGDPVEFLALAKSLNSCGLTKGVWLGTAKANIGHTEAASGLVGAVLQLRNAEIPPLPNFKRMNPEIVRGMEANGWGGYENDNWPVRLAAKKSVRIFSEGEDKVGILFA
uniref:Ketosynthase family 3 (KS3) domain-containing protein n=1 Tax=Meloidogyne javanica TaxID=6303 RepID=A0A915MYG0_MELJA